MTFCQSIARTYLKRQAARRVIQRPGKPLSAMKAIPKDVRKDGKDHYWVLMGANKRCALCDGNTRRGCSKCQKGLHLKCFYKFHLEYLIIITLIYIYFLKFHMCILLFFILFFTINQTFLSFWPEVLSQLYIYYINII